MTADLDTDDHPPLEIRAIGPPLAERLGELFSALAVDGQEFFHPHPLTVEYARKLCEEESWSSYFVLLSRGVAAGYGMLIAAEELDGAGVAVPQLGIAIHPGYRGQGLGRLMMLFLHAAARAAGMERIGLHVYKRNTRARELYASLGYTFVERDADGLLGTLVLSGAGTGA
jgi:ribosomal protein S18 acetylase RimI-like enzyme